jgi:pyrroline-5-carboxylate reductase
MAMLAAKIGFVGAGRMATALARGFVRAGLLDIQAIVASDPSDEARQRFSEALPGAAVDCDNQRVVSSADVVVLAVKPQQMAHVLADIRKPLRRDALVMSIAAGVTLVRLVAGLPAGQRIIRVMPNTPCLVGRGASGYSLGPGATAEDGALAAQLLSAVGVTHNVPEKMLDAVTGLSGSGPAFVYTMIEALAEGGVRAGLPPELAADLAARTVAGGAEMVLSTGETPAALRDRVTSPGGTTLAGLAALDKGGFRQTVIDAVCAAARRSAELGQTTT